MEGRERSSHCQYAPSRSLHNHPTLIQKRTERRSEKNYNTTAARRKTIPFLINRKLIKMKMQSFMSQMKEQDKMPERPLNEVKIDNIPEKEFKIMIVKMILDLGGKMEKMQIMFIKY